MVFTAFDPRAGPAPHIGGVVRKHAALRDSLETGPRAKRQNGKKERDSARLLNMAKHPARITLSNCLQNGLSLAVNKSCQSIKSVKTAHSIVEKGTPRI